MTGIRRIALALGVLTMLSACGLAEINRQIDVVDDLGVIKGKVDVQTDQQGPVVVLRFEVDSAGEVFKLENQVIASANGSYRFAAEPGEYLIAAFIDVNQDGRFQRGEEHGNFNTDPLTFSLNARQVVEVKTIVISGDPPILADGQRAVIAESAAITNIGKVVSLNDPQFTRDNYSMGMWRPIDFLQQVGGGLLFLEEYDSARVPVIFVHGISGGPTDLRKPIEALDSERYQPWILYYPSGLPLNVISDYFVRAVTDLQSKYGFTRFDVVAHSMGGLVSRSFVKKYVERFPERVTNIGFVLTVNSPMGGMASAAHGVDMSPIVVPAWRDVATNSNFLEDLHAWLWPVEIPYYLVFSHEEDSGDDGVVALESQIPLKLQSESERMYGFVNDHVGTLNDEAFIEIFQRIFRERVGAAGTGQGVTDVLAR